MYPLVLTLCVGLLIIYLMQKIFNSCRGKLDVLDMIPCPKGLPFIGNAFQMDSERPHQTIYKWARAYGDVFIFKAFGKKHLVVNSKEGLHEILVTRGDDYGGRPYMYRADFSFENKNITFQNVCPAWKNLRKVSHKAVKQYGDGLKSLESSTMVAVNALIEKFEDRKGESFDPRDDIFEAFTHMILNLIMGHPIPREDPIVKDVIVMARAYCDGLMGAGDGFWLDMFPWLRYFGNNSYKMLKRAVEMRDKLWKTHLPDLRKTHVPGKERGIFDSMYTAQLSQREVNGCEQLTDTELEMTLTDIVNGGTVTTSNTLYAFMAILLHHPEVQDKMYAEIQETIGKRQACVDDKHSMPYVRAVIMELLRYTSIGPLGLPHITLCDTKLFNYNIPKGTYVIPNLWAVNHDPKAWKKPWKFIPERFLDDNGNLVPPGHPVRKGFMPFGAGIRVCLGESLAKNRLFLAVVSITQRLQLLPAKTQDKIPPCDPRTYDFGGLLSAKSFQIQMVNRLQNNNINK